MFKNYIKIAFRNFKRHSGYTLINVFGLAVGLGCCLLIYLFVQLEISYDQFHEKSDRIYRVVTDITQSGNTRELAWSSPPLANALVNEFPEVEKAVRIHRPSGTMRRGTESEVVEVNFVDSTFFKVFDFTLTRGDIETALEHPGSVVLTYEQANRFFKDEDPLFKTLTFADSLELEVTGILADLPPNSHFQPQFLANIQTLPRSRFQSWQGMNLWTYIVVNPQTSGEDLESKLPDFIESRLGKAWAQLMTLHLQPLNSIYFESDRLPEIGPTGDSGYVFIFSGIGLFILVIACINFMNLATAQSVNRAKEVGIRKTLGVHRSQLIRQFLGESILLVLISMVLGLVLAQSALPAFEELSGYELSGVILLDPWAISILIGIAIIVGILSGFYPAFILSLFKPSAVLSGNVSFGKSNMKIHSSNNLLRRGLVVVQFGISVILLIATGIISTQLDYIQNKNLGFEKEQVVVIRLSDELRNSYDPLKQNLLRRSNILKVAASSQVPGVPIGPRGYTPEGMTDGNLLTNTLWVDEEYLSTMEIDLLAGRSYTRERPSELQQGLLLNEAAISHFGWSSAEEAMGKTIRTAGQNGIEGMVIGIVKDFNYESLHNTIKPLVVRYREQQNFLSVRIAGDQITNTMEDIETEWAAVAGDEPLVSWFMDDQLQDLYEGETRMAELFKYFSGLAIIIACLGLFGLASFSIQKRTKEIGIRKVLGATVSQIMLLFSKEYVVLVAAASIVACPVVYIAMSQWLNNFVYKTEMPFLLFLSAVAAILVIAFTTVGYHSIKAAKVNPVESLRSE